MKDLISEYYGKITQILDEIMEHERESVEAAARVLADAVVHDRLIHVFGAGGHSTIPAMDVFYRAGGLVQINAFFPPGMNVTNSHPTLARLPGTGKFILSYYDVKEGDPLIVINFYGVTSAGIDTALEARKMGVTLITVNSHNFSSRVPESWEYRHPSKKNLNEIADISIDNHVPFLDAVLELPGSEVKVTSTATIATVFVMNWLMTRTAQEIGNLGHKPDIWLSNNIPGGDEHNRQFVEKYRGRIPHLYPTW
ncbi:MAG TPA: sugar isomerase domain-containing protein [Spirochaetia bacterium]|nr:sugar isomerase domain-containing protein [Spirochaetia bacterium]